VIQFENIWQEFEVRPLIDENEAQVWRACLDDPQAWAPACQSLLSPDEKERALRYRFERHRQRFSSARAILRILLGWQLRIHPADVRFQYSPGGKPELAGQSDGRPLYFNVSHSDGLSLLALSRNCPVGVDVERIEDIKDPGLADVCFSPAEVAALQSLPGHLRLEGFYDLWTRKEARLKATGEGIANRLQQTCVLSDLERSTAVLDLNTASVTVEEWHFQKLSPSPGFKAVLAFPMPGLRVSRWQWNPLLAF